MKKKMTFIWIWAQRSCAFCCACHKLWYDFLLFWIDRSNNAVSCDKKVSLHCIEIYEIYWHFDDVSLFRNWAIKCTTHLLELLMQKCSYILIKHKASPTQSEKKNLIKSYFALAAWNTQKINKTIYRLASESHSIQALELFNGQVAMCGACASIASSFCPLLLLLFLLLTLLWQLIYLLRNPICHLHIHSSGNASVLSKHLFNVQAKHGICWWSTRRIRYYILCSFPFSISLFLFQSNCSSASNPHSQW